MEFLNAVIDPQNLTAPVILAAVIAVSLALAFIGSTGFFTPAKAHRVRSRFTSEN